MSKEIPQEAIDSFPEGYTLLGWGGEFDAPDYRVQGIVLQSNNIWSTPCSWWMGDDEMLFAAQMDSEIVKLNQKSSEVPNGTEEVPVKENIVYMDGPRKSIYCAGAMRNIPYFNFPAFDAARDRMIAEGWKVISPADIDREHGFDPKDLPEDTDWNDLSGLPFTIEDCFERDIEAVKACDAIYMLKGWQNSTGAQAEYWCARWLHKEVLYERVESTTKESNPKDAVGCKKVPLHGMPAPVLMECGLVKLHGDLKYGEYNWRDVGVRASIYYDALMRHMMAFWEGEDVDPDSGISHIAHAITGLAVLRDSMIQENWVDDRPKPTNLGWLSKMNDKAKEMSEKRK